MASVVQFSFSSTVQPLQTLNLVELFDPILLTRCTHFPAIFLLLDLFLFSSHYLGADMFFCLSLYSCSSTSFSLASSPLWLSLSMVFWQLFLLSIPHFLQHFSLLPLLNSPISPLLFPVSNIVLLLQCLFHTILPWLPDCPT